MLVSGMRLELGTSVRCTDGDFGKLADIVIDPDSKRVTHLVVDPRHPSGATRLVPVDLAEPGEGQAISLRCSLEEARACESARDFQWLRLDAPPIKDEDWDVGVQEVLAMPYYPNGVGEYVGTYQETVGISFDRVPKGEVEIRRASSVISADGDLVGHVEGFAVDSDDRISDMVLRHGHLWRKRDITIPISSVTKVETDTVTVGLTTEEIRKLPAVSRRRRLS
jgi:sporulation protein YlmC with PRC-barrel domain